MVKDEVYQATIRFAIHKKRGKIPTPLIQFVMVKKLED